MSSEQVGSSLGPGPLVTTGWLAENLDDPAVRVVDCRWYLRPFDLRNGDDEYAKAHIPGAVHVRWDTDIADPGRPDLWMLADEGRYAAAMSQRGIGDDTFVVAYDDQHVTVAARLWWSLRVYGHRNVAVLDGGITKWLSEGRPVDDQIPVYQPAQFTPRFDASLYATRDDVLTCIGLGSEVSEFKSVGFKSIDSEVGESEVLGVESDGSDGFEATGFEVGKSEVLGVESDGSEVAEVESQSTRLVDGRMAPARAADDGMIPGSIAIPGIEFTGTDGTWAHPAAARERIVAAGAEPGEPTIAYCRGGVGACGTALAYAIAGNDSVAVYDGSWTEWITDPNTPRAPISPPTN